MAKDQVTNVVNFSEIRTKKLEEKRKNTERFLVKTLLGIYCVTDENRMRGVELIDMSESGLSFVIPYDAEKPWPTDSNDIPLRLYFSQEMYLTLKVNIQNSKPQITDGIRYVRFGCTVDQTQPTYDTYKQFVGFLKKFSETAANDHGSTSVFFG